MAKAKAAKAAKATSGSGKGREWPASRVEMWPVSRIKEYRQNPRTHSEAQIALIADSMKSDGVTQPILVDEQGVIIAGHGRKLAAGLNGFDRYPVVIARGWSDEQKRAARIKDNQYAALSGYDEPLLRLELSELQLGGYDLPLLGFNEIELGQYLSLTPIEDGQAPRVSLSESFGIVPFSVLNAREGWWQDRKRAWLALGIQSELGRGATASTSARVGPDDAPTYRPIGGRANAAPGGSLMPSADYSKKERGDGRGRPLRHKPNAIPGGAPMPLDRAKDKAKKANGGGTLGAIAPNERAILGRTGKYKTRARHG